MTDKQSAWSDFWAQQRGGGDNGCLPARWQSVIAVLEQTWRSVAEDLAEDACVLDLATGDARVLHWMGQARPGLERIGVDLSPQLPPGPEGVKLHTNVAMEDLPFEDAKFDAVVSQFGVEYGKPEGVAREVARVANDTARIAFVVHRGDGAILAHNLARAEQIHWVLDEARLIDTTKAALAREQAPWEDATGAVAASVAEGRERYGDQSAGWEIPEAIRRTLLMGARAGDTAEGVGSVLDRIEAQAKNELARITSLEGACATADARDAFLGAFEAAGLRMTRSEELRDAAGRLFAEALHFEKG